MAGLEHYLVLGALLFVVGTAGVLVRRNAIVVFMGIELMLNGAALTILASSRFLDRLDGHAVTFFVIAVAAAEAAVGLAIIVLVDRHRGTANVDEVAQLKH